MSLIPAEQRNKKKAKGHDIPKNLAISESQSSLEAVKNQIEAVIKWIFSNVRSNLNYYLIMKKRK